MPPCMIERPRGTGDYLIMLFHDPAAIGCRPGPDGHCRPDTMMIWTPGEGQYYGNRSQRFSHTWIHCEGTRLPQILRSASVPLRRPFQVASPSRFQQCLLDIHGELVSYSPPDLVIIGNLLENCLREISRATGELRKSSMIPGNLVAVRRLIGTAPAREITLGEMARMAGMSVPYFCSRFKAAFGLSPMECLIQHRMHHAAHLLNDRTLAVAAVAEAVGYNDPFHFSKMFKKHFGMSPRSMRERKPGL